MAVTKCKECSGLAAISAETCSRCGVRVRKKVGILGWLLVLLVMLPIAWSFGKDMSPSGNALIPDAGEYQLSGLHAVTIDKDGRVRNEQTKVSPPPDSIRKGQVLFAVLGDSRTANSFISGGTRSQPRSYPFWVELFTRGAARFMGAWNFGIAGQNTTQILARVDAVIASGADAVVILCGVNDNYGAPTLNNIQAMVDAIVRAGKLAVVVTELPRGNMGASTWSKPRILQHWEVHKGLMQMAKQPGVRIVNAMPLLLDPASPIGGFKPGYSYDNLHLTSTGAMLLGRAIADVVNEFCTTPVPLLQTNNDRYDVNRNQAGNHAANGMMAGSAGVLEGPGAPTGVVADNWHLYSTAHFVTASSKINKHGNDWQQLEFSGTPLNAGQYVSLYQDIPAENFAAGDVVEAICEIEVEAGSVGMYGPEFNLIVDQAGAPEVTAAPAVSVGWQDPMTTTSANPSEAYDGVYRAQPYIFTSNPSSIRLQMRIRGKQGVSSSGTFRVSRISLRKIL